MTVDYDPWEQAVIDKFNSVYHRKPGSSPPHTARRGLLEIVDGIKAITRCNAEEANEEDLITIFLDKGYVGLHVG